jgi:hypothetical protein
VLLLPCSPPASAAVAEAAVVGSAGGPSEAELAPAADGGAADDDAGAACGGCCINGSGGGGWTACVSFVVAPCAVGVAVDFLKKRSRNARPLPLLLPLPTRGCVADGRPRPPPFLLLVLILREACMLVRLRASCGSPLLPPLLTGAAAAAQRAPRTT